MKWFKWNDLNEIIQMKLFKLNDLNEMILINDLNEII